MATPARRRPGPAATPAKTPAPVPPPDETEGLDIAGDDGGLSLDQDAPSDELTLAPSKPSSHPKMEPPRSQKKRKRVDAVDGKPVDVDTSNLLVYAGIAVVVCVIGGVLWLILSNRPDKTANVDPTATPAANAPSSPGAPTSPGNTPASPGTPKVDYTANPANKAAFHAMMKFTDWAMINALEMKAPELIKKFQSAVPMAGVTDPEVKDLYNKLIEFFTAGGDHPLNAIAGSEVQIDNSGRGGIKADANGEKQKALMLKLYPVKKAVSQRYGPPPGMQ